MLLFIIVFSATTTADGPLLKTFGIGRDSKSPREDTIASPQQNAGPGHEASAQSVLQQVAHGVFPATLWAAVHSWPPAPHVASNTGKDTLEVSTGSHNITTAEGQQFL